MLTTYAVGGFGLAVVFAGALVVLGVAAVNA